MRIVTRAVCVLAFAMLFVSLPAYAQDGFADVLFIYNGEVLMDFDQFEYGLPPLSEAIDPDGDQWFFAFTVRVEDEFGGQKTSHQIVLEVFNVSGTEADLEPFTLVVSSIDERAPIRHVITTEQDFDVDLSFTETSVTMTNVATQSVAPGQSHV